MLACGQRVSGKALTKETTNTSSNSMRSLQSIPFPRRAAASFNHQIELTEDALLKAAPSIFARQPMAGVSGKYTFLPTVRIVEEMRANGWAAVDAQEQRVRLEDRRGYQKHVIRFQRRDIVAKVGEYAPEIALLNSHDRSSAYQIHVALFRFVCGNGLMVSDSTFSHVSIRHSGYETGEVLQASFEMLAKIPELTGKVEMFKARRLTQESGSTHSLVRSWIKKSPAKIALVPDLAFVGHRQRSDA